VGNFKLAKNYVDQVNASTVKFVRSKDLAFIYAKLGDALTDPKAKLECYRAAADNFARSKDWLKVCKRK